MMIQSLRIVLIVASILGAVAFAVLGGRRFAEPQPLHPVETAILDQATRFASGQPAYTEPRPDAVSPAVMPGLPLAVSLLARAYDPFFWEARLLSLLAVFYAAGLVLLLVRVETGSLTIGAISAGLTVSSFALFSAPLGSASVEAPMLALALAGLTVLRFTRGLWGVVGAAVLLSVAFFTQESALLFISAALIWLALDDMKRALAFAIMIALLCGGGFVLLSHFLGAWFNYYAWDVPINAMRFAPGLVLHYVSDQLLGKLGVLTLAAVLALALPVRPWRGTAGLWTCAGAAALVVGLLATQSATPGPAAMLPTLTLLALLGPISLQRVTRHLSTWPGSSRLGGKGVVMTALALQFIALASGAPATLRAANASSHERSRPPAAASSAVSAVSPVVVSARDSAVAAPATPVPSGPSLPR